MFDHVVVALECPDCGLVSAKTIGWLKSNEVLVCTACRNLVRLDKKRFTDMVAEQERRRVSSAARAKSTASIPDPWPAAYVQFIMSSSRKLPQPLKLKSGSAIATLADAARLILKLPPSHRKSPHWARTAELLVRAAESGLWTDMAKANVELWRSLLAGGFLETPQADKARFSLKWELGTGPTV